MQKYLNSIVCSWGAVAGLVVAASMALCPPRLDANLVIINDGMSDPTRYSFGSANSAPFNPDDVSFVNVDFPTDGGNPDAQFFVTHTHEVLRDGDGNPLNGDGLVELYSFFTYLPTTYTPSVSGSIETISFSLDVFYDDIEEDFNRLFFYVEDQNGAFLGGNADLATDVGWQTITVSGLTGADFPGRDFGGSLPLSFGFGFVSNVEVSGGPLSSSIRADNFRVSITAVPEPGSLTLLTMFAGLAMVRRRR